MYPYIYIVGSTCLSWPWPQAFNPIWDSKCLGRWPGGLEALRPWLSQMSNGKNHEKPHLLMGKKVKTCTSNGKTYKKPAFSMGTC